MNLWLKAEGYSVTQVNKLPTVIYAVQIVASWFGTTIAAIYPSWAIYSIASLGCLFSTLCMIIWNIPKGLKYVLSGTYLEVYNFKCSSATLELEYPNTDALCYDDLGLQRGTFLVCLVV